MVLKVLKVRESKDDLLFDLVNFSLDSGSGSEIWSDRSIQLCGSNLCLDEERIPRWLFLNNFPPEAILTQACKNLHPVKIANPLSCSQTSDQTFWDNFELPFQFRNSRGILVPCWQSPDCVQSLLWQANDQILVGPPWMVESFEASDWLCGDHEFKLYSNYIDLTFEST